MFYSQILQIAHIDNTCSRCEQHFPNWGSYHTHATMALCARKLKPLNTSGRSKAQIVANFEQTKLKGALIS